MRYAPPRHRSCPSPSPSRESTREAKHIRMTRNGGRSRRRSVRDDWISPQSHRRELGSDVGPQNSDRRPPTRQGTLTMEYSCRAVACGQAGPRDQGWSCAVTRPELHPQMQRAIELLSGPALNELTPGEARAVQRERFTRFNQPLREVRRIVLRHGRAARGAGVRPGGAGAGAGVTGRARPLRREGVCVHGSGGSDAEGLP